MSVFKRFRKIKIKRGDNDYDKGTWYATRIVDGVRYLRALRSAKTKIDARTEEDLIVAKIRHGEFEYIKDKTKFSDFVDRIYLPYCEINNDNYNTKTYETNSLKTFFGNVLLKSITPSRIEEFKRKRSTETVRCQKCLNGKHEKNEKCDAKLISTSTVNRKLSTLKKLLNVAVQNRKLKENPMRFVRMLNEPKPRERIYRKTKRKDCWRQSAKTVNCRRLSCSR